MSEQQTGAPGGPESADEEPLTGGNASGVVVRRGDTVRKPWLTSTPSVQDYLRVLIEEGVRVPRPLGRDHRGRQNLAFIPGELALHGAPLRHGQLAAVGRLIRQIHSASAGVPLVTAGPWNVLLPSPGTATLVCHNDLAPWNLIIDTSGETERMMFIDWDGAGPSTRIWDLAYAAQSFAQLVEGQSPEDGAERLRALLSGYRPDKPLRHQLTSAMIRRTAAMHQHLEESARIAWEPWATMYADGHGEHWAATHRYLITHRELFHRAINVT